MAILFSAEIGIMMKGNKMTLTAAALGNCLMIIMNVTILYDRTLGPIRSTQCVRYE